MKTPAPKLRAGVVYSADNGELICIHCAGATALYTGRDRSGMKVKALNQHDADEWKAMVGSDLHCERGCTTHKPARWRKLGTLERMARRAV